MLFNSTSFFFFFIVVAAIHFALPQGLRWVWLLGSSYYFYLTWDPFSLLFLVAITCVTFLTAFQMGKANLRSTKFKYLLLGVFFNGGMLFAFKYYNFFCGSLRSLLGESLNSTGVTLLLPIGISFYTFKCISYCVDLYRGDLTPETHLGRFALYVAFFPQLLAGPIERAKSLIPQFSEKVPFDSQRVSDGLKLILWGLFQKMVIADNVSRLVNSVYNQPDQYVGAGLAMATFFYAFQIYCDFSGYSYISMGTAQVLGFKTMENFNRPYFATSLPDFWRRWHISLSTWFRDYLYIPLGGNRVPLPRWYFNLFIVMLVCGLWHGANWTFIAWGGLHGIYLVTSAVTRKVRGRLCDVLGLSRRPRVHHGLRVSISFSLVCLAWIFFRANSLPEALYILTHLFVGWGDLSDLLGRLPFWNGMRFEFITGLVAIGVLIGVEILEQKGPFLSLVNSKPIWIRWPFYYTLLLSILLFGEFGSKEFIYFQF